MTNKEWLIEQFKENDNVLEQVVFDEPMCFKTCFVSDYCRRENRDAVFSCGFMFREWLKEEHRTDD